MGFGKISSGIALAVSMSLLTVSGASAAGMGPLGGLKAAAPQSQIVHVKGKGARNVGLGILGAAAAVAIIAGASNAAKAEERRRYDDDYEGGNRCSYYDRKCEQGHGWACRKFDQRCTD